MLPLASDVVREIGVPSHLTSIRAFGVQPLPFAETCAPAGPSSGWIATNGAATGFGVVATGTGVVATGVGVSVGDGVGGDGVVGICSIAGTLDVERKEGAGVTAGPGGR